MSEQSPIEWCDHSFNTHWGCSKVSPGCDNCYAESMAKRLLPTHTTLWQPNGERRFFGKEHWMGPLRWERRAAKTGRRERVFCASMADVFDNHEDLPPVREMLWELIRKTPHLDWLILTKRIGNAKSMLPADWGDGYPNVWLGASIVNQPEADRDIGKLLRTPARVHFISFEPLLGPIRANRSHTYCPTHDYAGGFCSGPCPDQRPVDWIIIGGESGHRARPMESNWAFELISDYMTACVPVFFKQGSQANWPDFKNFVNFPLAFQVREWPEARA